MKNSSSFILVLLGLSFMGLNLTVTSQTRINFNGLWRTADDVLVNIIDSGSNIIVKYVGPGDCPTGHNCVLGGGAPYYLKGTVSANNKMELTMMRCTHKKDMRDEGLADHWTTKCKVTTVTNKSISGTWRTEWYQNDTRADGREFNFRRDPGGDSDSPFSLTRTNCKEELEKLVAEIDLKAETLKQQEESIADVDKNFEQAKQGWYNEVQDQLKEEVFQGVVPPSVKPALPGSFGQDLGSYIESWVDFVAELAKSGGNFALERAAKIVLLYDLMIDWGNVNAKGLVTLDELGQMNKGLVDMRDRKDDTRRSWVNAMLEYRKLSDLCAGEIPPDKQPKPAINSSFDKEKEEFERSRQEDSKALSSISSGIQSAKTDLTKTANAIKSLQQLLEPYRNADPNKTMKEIMSAAGIIKLQNGLIDAGKNWINLFKQLKAIEESRKKLTERSKPGVG
jgi:hypothetical protein